MIVEFLFLSVFWPQILASYSQEYSKKKYEQVPTFGSDDEGNAVIEIPRKYWHGKNYHSLKIHLSKKVLQNLTHGFRNEDEYYYCKFDF